jgi:UDP-glucose:(heptosyl)LPS alpha-1,3-glucosyltransferase
LRIAVISPAVDRQHGTERAVAELIDRLRSDYADDIDLYAERASDLTLTESSRKADSARGSIRWRRVKSLPGPHLLRFLGWLFGNRFARARDGGARGKTPDAIFSPGINALDADVILVHVVFHRVAELQKAASGAGLRALHRKLYYALLCRIERRIYTNPEVALAAVSNHTAKQLARYFQRADVAVIRNGVDAAHFSASAIARMRESSRAQWNFSPEHFVLLLIGNDWRNKGLNTLLAAAAKCRELPIRLMIVGQDDPAPFREAAENLGVPDRLQFCPPAADVRTFYAAADALVSPSLEDSFNLPLLEAMSCGLPVVASPRAGISEWLTAGRDCLLLNDPENADELAAAIRSLVNEPAKRYEISANAVKTAAGFSWDTHTSELRKLMVKAAEAKRQRRQR